MKEIASNIKYATYLDKFEVISFIEKCLMENNLQYFPHSIDKDIIEFDKNFINENMLIFRIDNKIIGTAAYKIIKIGNTEIIKIVRVYLDTKYKGLGYGKILFMTLLSIIRIKHSKFRFAYLQTNTEKMKPAFNMYQNFGFKQSKDFSINKLRSNILMKIKL